MRPRLIVALLALILVTVLGFAWQANRTVEAYNETAAGVLRDYAGLAADEFARRSMAQIGYYGYFTEINRLREALNSGSGLRSGNADRNSPVDVAFSVTQGDPPTITFSDNTVPSAVQNYVLTELRARTSTALPEFGVVIDHAVIDGLQMTFAFSWVDAAAGFFGFVVNRDWISTALQTAFAEKNLLPASLADGAVSNDLLYVRMLDRSGGILFQNDTNYDVNGLVEKTLGGDYGGVVQGFRVAVAIDPVLGRSLIIGGLPQSRLPALIAIIVLATVLLIAAIWQLQRELNVMRMRSNFVAEVSHELRTPLTQIRMFAESLLYERLPNAADKQRALSIINRESQRLINLVENILRFSSSSQAEHQASPSAENLGLIIQSVVDEFQVLAEANGSSIETSIAEDVITDVDADAVRQILLNLLDNAVKYGPPGQTITVTLEKKRIGLASISIADEGPGIPPSERGRIWESYYRLERERHSAIAGTGIGLAVVADLARMLNGTLRIDDNAGTGARFSLELPL